MIPEYRQRLIEGFENIKISRGGIIKVSQILHLSQVDSDLVFLKLKFPSVGPKIIALC